MNQIDMKNRKIHWTHKARMKKLYLDGYSIEEIALTYNISYYVVKNLLRGIKKPERI